MTKIPYEIPAEIRDLTAKSVEEAHKAFESFIEAAHKATAQAEGTATALQSSAKDVSAKTLSFTEANLKAAFDHAQKLIHAKDPQEMLAHQSEYVKKQLAALEEQAKELGTAVLKAVTPDK
jgi:phasin